MKRSPVVCPVIDPFLYVNGPVRNIRLRIDGCENHRPVSPKIAKVCVYSLIQGSFLTYCEEISILDHSIEIKWTEPVLLAFYANSLVPRLIQPGSREQYHDPGHISSLMRMSETVRYATMACSAMSLCGNFSKDPNWNRGMRRQALSYQASAIKSIQAQIKAGVVDGTEDWLLLAATKLHLTDVCMMFELSTFLLTRF